MRRRTVFDDTPKLVRFDAELRAMSAATMDDFLAWVATDKLNVHGSIVRHCLRDRHRSLSEDAWCHMIAEIVEAARKRPDTIRATLSAATWRYYFTRTATNQLQGTGSTFYYTYVQKQSVTSSAKWNEGSEWYSDRHESKHEFREPRYQYDDDHFDLTDVVCPANGHEQAWKRFLKNLELLFREVEWWNVRVWVLKNTELDPYGWLADARRANPRARMTYRLISKRTTIPVANLHAAVQHVNAVIRERYEVRFGEAIPSFLADRL